MNTVYIWLLLITLKGSGDLVGTAPYLTQYECLHAYDRLIKRAGKEYRCKPFKIDIPIGG